MTKINRALSLIFKKEGKIMQIQFITDVRGKKTAAIVPYDEWERTEKAKDILEHVYLAGIIKERRVIKGTLPFIRLLSAMPTGLPRTVFDDIPHHVTQRQIKG